MPFHVVVQPEFLLGTDALRLGTIKLDSQTACGDTLDLGERGVYIVRRVAFIYRFFGGKYTVTSKRLDVEPISTRPLTYLQ